MPVAVAQKEDTPIPVRPAGENARFPWWAHLYSAYNNRIPIHRGKGLVLRLLHSVGLRQKKPFLWRMKNGTILAISPVEGLTPTDVGWTCFEHGVWEPHVEVMLRRLLRDGDVAVDVGANIGYFSAVMAQCVGASGIVFAFEPVPPIHTRLMTNVAANKWDNLIALQTALGSTNSRIEINFDPAFPGGSSLYLWDGFRNEKETFSVDVHPLDDLVEAEVVRAPRLIKVDVEGNELEVLKGARNTLTKAKPFVITEFNSKTSASANWVLTDMGDLLKSCGYRFFYLLGRDGRVVQMDPDVHRVLKDDFIDILASAEPVDAVQ